MKKIISIVVVLIMLFGTINVFAATEVQATLDKTKAAINETITATIVTSKKDDIIKIVEEDGNVVLEKTSGYKEKSGKREWIVEFSLTTAGSRDLKVFSQNDESFDNFTSVKIEITNEIIQPPVVGDAKIRSDAVKIIVAQEGTYNSVSLDDNGALSVGMMQWHGPNAHDLMKSIRDRDPALARELLKGTTIYNELDQANYTWNKRILASSEKTPVANFISSAIGKQQQDLFAENYMNDYITRAKNRGITSGGAIIFYCDLAIQGGPGNANGVSNLITGTVTLDKIYQASLNHYVMGQYSSRRTKVYNSIKALGYS